MFSLVIVIVPSSLVMLEPIFTPPSVVEVAFGKVYTVSCVTNCVELPSFFLTVIVRPLILISKT